LGPSDLGYPGDFGSIRNYPDGGIAAIGLTGLTGLTGMPECLT
jgi:hypothetical protein